jgi:hypothetical protein
MKDSSIKFSLSTLTLLSLAAVAATPTLATTNINEQPHSPSTNEIPANKIVASDLPFFARFLEGQNEEIADANVASTDRLIANKPLAERRDRVRETRKFPSDREDNHGGSVNVTKKYPSDGEDNSGGGSVTRKYPSDNEDNSGGGQVFTQKFPSDGEDNTGGNPPLQHRK